MCWNFWESYDAVRGELVRGGVVVVVVIMALYPVCGQVWLQVY